MTKSKKKKAERAKEINSFSGEYKFLSNFYLHPLKWCGVTYPAAENAYQAMKTLNMEERKEFESITPSKAKQRGRQVEMRDGWEEMKVNIMYDILKIKFSDYEIQNKLLATHPRPLVEGNWWGDEYWGRCDGKGANKLGKLLMKVRDNYMDGWRKFKRAKIVDGKVLK